ncbi:acyltransferase family protein [Stutzerimonas nitrititolerans]|uniref:acyltransferase family protein n=1 Tax=Stutzerimonas nitrititolerans TaxID=2482751 RepID=UPI0028ADC678|nr:acyltransferase family protein [Stutzerimonas nitrititolerans]
MISIIILNSLTRGHFSFSAFYGRRIKRIFPALLIVLISSFIFGWFALLSDEYKQLGKHIFGGASFISNIMLWREHGYFDGAAEVKPLLHLWSLGIEEQFYIFWPALLWAAWKSKLNLLTVTVAAAIITFVLNVNKTQTDIIAAFYLPQTRFWELLAGSILAHVSIVKPVVLAGAKMKVNAWLGAIIKSPEKTSRALSDMLALLGSIIILAGILVIRKELAFPGWFALLPVIGAALIISAGTQAWINRVVLSNKVLVWFGLISFPLYLWHWPILSFLRIIEGDMPSSELRIAAVILSTVLAWLTYKFIEKPMRRVEGGRTKVVTLLLLMIVTGFAGYNCYKRDGYKFRDHLGNMDSISSEFVGLLWKYTKNDRCMAKHPLVGSENYGWWFCMASKDESPTLLLLGNSYANELYAGLSRDPAFNHHSILSIGTCDPAWIDESVFIEPVPGYEYSPCVGFRHADQQRLINGIVKDSTSLEQVIISGLANEIDEDYILRLKKKIDFLESHSIKIIIFTPHVVVDYDIKGCFARPFKSPKNDCIVAIEENEKITNKLKPLIDFISTTNPNVAFFDQNSLFCNGVKCSMIRDGMPLLRDSYGHISEYGSVVLAGIFKDWAKKHAPGILNPVSE